MVVVLPVVVNSENTPDMLIYSHQTCFQRVTNTQHGDIVKHPRLQAPCCFLFHIRNILIPPRHPHESHGAIKDDIIALILCVEVIANTAT